MNAKFLLASLKTQEVNLTLLIEALETQKQSIVKNDYSLLENSIAQEQVILGNIEREELTRVKVVKDIATQFGLELRSNTLEDLVSKGSKHFEKDIMELSNIRKSLREKIQKISNTNSQLKDVITFSRNLIKETMMIVAGSNRHLLVNKRV
jgi:hypothetical protein